MLNYLEQDADRIRSNLPTGASAPDNADALFLLYAVLLRAKGTEVELEDVHDAWSAWMTGVDPGHPSLVSFDRLDEETKAEDEPFLVAIRFTASTVDSA